jgi:NCS1 family nucleobase:cation symporter-1
LICAPIAVETRLTLYWYLRRIGGPFVTVIYNVLNAVLFCILAGCMITVSASAVRIPFGIQAQVNWYPNDPRFVLVALGVGAVVVTVAILGFKKLAVFAAVCSPWMFLMFLAGAVVMLPPLADKAEAGSDNVFLAFWEIARDVVWTGTTPDGSQPLGFWKVVAFAWICNLAMHGGLSDMALFRYAKKARYGLFSAFGMFLGHYLAWICAGMMGVGAALLLNSPLASLDSGEVAYQALGWAGVVAVIAAGWTTANPTLYRAGLALQAITPDWSRARVTLIAGAATTSIACFPFVFTRLLDFVGIYGLLLAPAGAIVLTEHWIFPRIGFTRYWASYRKVLLNWPALVAWIVAIGVGFALERAGILHLFYLFVPVYVLTSVLYIALASLAGARDKYAGAEPDLPPSKSRSKLNPAAVPEPSRSKLWITGAVALSALLVCFAAPILVAANGSDGFTARHESLKVMLAGATLVYFVFGVLFYRLRTRE